jgi:YVTN family beta-propeller protein
MNSFGVRMNFRLAARLLGILILGLLSVSCGDQYRPVAVPVIPPPPDPQAVHFVLVFSSNGAIDPGASSRVDISGDSNIGVAQLGLGPAHATLTPTASRVFAVNTLEDSVSSYSPTPGSTAATVVTTSLPAGSHPVFVHTTENGTVYVANYGNNAGNNTVAAISAVTNVVMNPLISVGNQPVALAETPDQKKLYAVNQGDGTVTAITLADRTVTQTIATGSAPVWALARSDSARVYVLNSGSGTVSAIDTTADAVVGSASVGAGANYMVYDSKLNRLYVTNPVANTVTAVSVAADPPVVVFSTSVAPGPSTVSVLPDGSRIYAVSSHKTPPCTSIPGDTQLCISSGVTVINASDGSVSKTIPLESTVNITAATHQTVDPTYLIPTTTYTYTLTSGPALRSDSEVVVAGMNDTGNNGTFRLLTANTGSFTVASAAGATASSQNGVGAEVVEVSAVTGCDINGLGIPGGVLGGVRFRFSSAASADSSKLIVGKCDSGSSTIIRTSDDTPVLDMPAPLSTVTPPGGGDALPQNPVFVLTGP